MKNIYIFLASFALVAQTVCAQDAEPTLKITPTGRILMDGAIYASPEKEMFKDGMAIPDARLGVKATYGKWSGKIDVGFAGNKVGLKDLFFQYTFDSDNSIKIGSFIHQYGLQSSTSSSMKCTFEEPLSNAVFNASRQIGFMYQHSVDKYMGTFSMHVEPNAITMSPNQTNQQGYGILTRQIYRPIHTEGNVVQVGISGGFLSPQGNGENNPHDIFSFSSTFPTRVDKVTIASVTINDALNQWKFTPELLLASGPVALEAQYFYNRVNMKYGMRSYAGQGAYATLRGLLSGGAYGYGMVDGGLATPAPNSLEAVLCYNYTTMSDPKAEYMDDGTVRQGIFGGRVNNISATLNYYINKYMLLRVNYTYTYRWNSSTLPDVTFNVFQARLQIIF